MFANVIKNSDTIPTDQTCLSFFNRKAMSEILSPGLVKPYLILHT